MDEPLIDDMRKQFAPVIGDITEETREELTCKWNKHPVLQDWVPGVEDYLINQAWWQSEEGVALTAEFDDSWDEFAPDFIKRVYHHGLAYWAISICMPIAAWPWVTCGGGPPAWIMIGVTSGIMLAIVADEHFLLHAEQPYYNIVSIFAPARYVATYGWDKLELQQAFTAMKVFSNIADGMILPQVFACGISLDKEWLATWADGFFAFLVPLMEFIGYGGFVVLMYIVTHLVVNLSAGLVMYQRYCEMLSDSGSFVGAAHALELVEWAGMPAMASAFKKLNETDIKSIWGTPECWFRIKEGEHATLHRTAKATFQGLTQMYISATLLQLAWGEKTKYGRVAICCTTFASMALVVKALLPLKKISVPDYHKTGLAIVVTSSVILVIICAKLWGAFYCDSHKWDIFPPHCVALNVPHA